MSNPSSSSSSSADPLANIITQVSQTATGVPTKGGPARPTRVAKQGEKKKKKKESSGLATAAPEPAQVASETKADDEEQQSHSHKPSSTLVGTSTTKSSHIISQSESGKTQGDGSAPPNADAEAAAAASSDEPTKDAKSTSKAANEAQKPGLGGKEKTLSGTQAASAGAASSPRSDGTSLRTAGEKTPSSRQSEKATGTGAKRKTKKVGIVGKIIAILTCTSASGAAVKEEEEMSEKRATTSKTRNAKAYENGQKSGASSAAGLATGQLASSRLSPRSAGVKGARAPSPRGSMDKTVGGGTRLPRDETGDVMSGAVVPPGSTFVVQDGDAKKTGTGGSGSSSMDKGGDDDGDDEGGRGDDDDDDDDDEGEDGWMGDDQLDDDEDQTEEQRLILQGGAGIPRDEDGTLHPLLGPIHEQDHGRKCLVLDLDETLVHSSFKMISNADFTVPVEIEGTVHNVYVIKRPGVDEFMRKMGEIYEVVVFTASLSKYADPVLDILDIHQVVRHRLFRESCYNHRGNYVKDLSQLGRDIETSIIIDNSPASYIFHPNNAVPISSWFNDPHDTELTDLCPFLAELAEVQDVRAVLDGGL